MPNFTQAQLEGFAVAGIEQGADWEGMDSDEIYSDAFDLAFDGLLKNVVDAATARQVADKVARQFAQP